MCYNLEILETFDDFTIKIATYSPYVLFDNSNAGTSTVTVYESKYLIIEDISFSTLAAYNITTQYGSIYQLEAGIVTMRHYKNISTLDKIGASVCIKSTGGDFPVRVELSNNGVSFFWCNAISYTAAKGAVLSALAFFAK